MSAPTAAADTNPWASLARERKAHAIVMTLARVMPTMTADEAAEMDDIGRRAAAHLARVNPCSEEAWALVVSTMRQRERAA